MQSYSDAPVDALKKLSVAERNSHIKGKENYLTSSVYCQQNKQKQTVENAVPHGPQKSKLPVLSKARAPPDFHKMHHTWQTHFQKGKAVCKKSCTRPQPFNFSQRGERSRDKNADERIPGPLSNGQPSSSSQASREPLAEVVLSQNKKESSVVKVGSEEIFKADPAALASILSNVGVSAAPVGKVSLAQRVPIKASIAHPLNSGRNTLIRSSMYTVPNTHIGSSNLDRMSCFSKMTVKANEQKPLFRLQNKKPIAESTVKEPAGLKKDELHPQENPVLQQMNQPPHVPTSDKTSCFLTTQEDNLTKLTSLPAISDETGTLSPRLCEISSTHLNGSAGKKDFVKTDTSSVDFVEDSQALACILSNTEINNTNCRKLSLAQRVPMQGRSSIFKGAMVRSLSKKHSGLFKGKYSFMYYSYFQAFSGTFMMQATTPKPACGSISNVPLKDLIFSPCRVPLVTIDKTSGESARRVFQPLSSVKFSQSYSATSKQPVFPKTPRALALEKANKCLEADQTEVQTSAKATIKWADELSPSPLSEILCEHKPKLEKVAMRLFLDGEGSGDSEKKQDYTAVSDPLIVLESRPTNAPQQTEPDAHKTDIEDSRNFQLCSQMQLPRSSQSSTNNSSSSVVSCIKSTVPLSFLSHPAVQAMQSCTLGPCSLPDIARLRLQAAVSAKQRFWETCLDEECAFYTSRNASGSIRSCEDPVSLFLEKQEDMHFTPICPGES